MAKRDSDKIRPAERVIRVLEYLKRNTDRVHPITQNKLREAPELAGCVGAKETSNDMITGLALALNTRDNGEPLPEGEWRIMFDEYRRRYGSEPRDDDERDEEEEPDESRRMEIRHLYYQPVFSYEEVDMLIESVRFSRLLDEKTAKRLTGKILDHLTGKYYPYRHAGIHRIYEPAPQDRGRMHENLSAILRAIDDNVKIEFRFNGYDRAKRLVNVGEPYVVSPYYVVADSGRYYLIGSPDGRDRMFIWRIDLMTDVAVYGKGDPRVPRRMIESMPPEWTDEFQFSHLDMSFDEPERIRLRITPEPGRPGYTFLHDRFGDNFRCVGADEAEVMCSPFGMVNFAVRYGEYVEVLSPEHVRAAVVGKIENLSKKYGI